MARHGAFYEDVEFHEGVRVEQLQDALARSPDAVPAPSGDALRPPALTGLLLHPAQLFCTVVGDHIFRTPPCSCWVRLSLLVSGSRPCYVTVYHHREQEGVQYGPTSQASLSRRFCCF